MRFVRGIVTGMLVGTALGVMNSDKMMSAMRKGQRGLRKFRRRMAR